MSSNPERPRSMKKIYIALAVLATAALASCEQEKSFNDVKVGENGLVFSFQGTASTRAAEGISPVQKGATLELEADEDGQKLFLEETIQDLNGFSPETKGTPAYTENVGVLYADNLSVYGDKGNFTTATTFVNMDDAQVDGGGWRYYHNYLSDPWPAGEAVGFYLNMPASPDGLTISSRTGGKFNISYTTPTDAASQEDILFAYRSMDKATYTNNYKKNGIPVFFNHALTGVKFAIANYDKTEKITIKSVSFTGLVGTATCEITPALDNTTSHSSALESVVKWVIPATPDRSQTYTSGEFTDTVYFAPGAGSFQNNGEYPSSFSAGGNEHNLNDGDASQTFWFIPQAMTDDVELTIEYTFGSATTRTGIINFGEVLSGVEWKAGQLRTYTIRVDEVNVKIEDTVTIGSGQTTTYTDDHGDVHTIYGGTKSGIKITNTGNTDAFIRAAITGQWVDENDAPVFSFTDFADTTGDIIKEIDSWYNDQFGTGNGKFGVFDGLVGYTKNGKTGTGNTGWVKGNDGYYYYTTKVAPNATTGTALFNTYTVTLAQVPRIKVAGELQDVHFVMEISTQAISAKKQDGTDYAWNKAWENALGKDPSAN